MNKLRLKLAQILAGKDNLVVPMVPTERMRISLCAQMSHNIPFEKAYRAMMMLSPNYQPEKAADDSSEAS